MSAVFEPWLLAPAGVGGVFGAVGGRGGARFLRADARVAIGDHAFEPGAFQYVLARHLFQRVERGANSLHVARLCFDTALGGDAAVRWIVVAKLHCDFARASFVDPQKPEIAGCVGRVDNQP